MGFGSRGFTHFNSSQVLLATIIPQNAGQELFSSSKRKTASGGASGSRLTCIKLCA
jgi:hypothetical protein